MTTLERFLKYIKIDTTSNSKNPQNPSTDNQKIFAKILIDELKELNIDYIDYDKEHCYVYACLKGDSKLPKIGFISHMDTSENAKGDDIKPRLIAPYNGGKIYYQSGNFMSTEKNPDLLNHIGKTLVVTDGTTLLGADDKAGIAEIMSMLEYYKINDVLHGDIYVCFTPDEEIGLGFDNFDKSKFPVDYAFTVDGSSLGEISYETFNAATVNIEITGISTHTGYAKDKMINALLIANQINNLLPYEIPSNTEYYAGFYHLDHLQGDTAKATMQYLIRDFDIHNFEMRKSKLKNIVETLNEQYGNCINLKIKDTYYNMKKYLPKNFKLTNYFKACFNCNIEPKITPTRGATDGLILTYMGIPCPNIGTGGHNFHSIYEYIAVEDLEKTKDLLIAIVQEYCRKEDKEITNEAIKRTRIKK